MRHTRVHNLVEVDGKNFMNETPGSTTGGTGWTRAFSPAPGSQAQKSWLGEADDGLARHSRLTLFGQGGDPVFAGNAYSTYYKYDFPFLYAQKRSEAEGLQSTFVSTVETYAGEPFIASQRALKINNNDSDAKAAAAVEVLLKNGRRDLLFADGRPAKVRSVEGGLIAAGEFGFYSTDAQGLRQMHLMGGTQLHVGGIGIKAQYARYQGKITGVDYDHRTFTINSKILPGALAGEVALLGNPQHQAEFNLTNAAATAGGTRIQTVETPQYYQSRILNIDKSGVTPELEPGAYRSDSQYYEGATVTNEAHNKFWKAHLTSDERWMYIGWPGYRTSVPVTISDKDVPDANKDGKRILDMKTAERIGDKTGKEVLPLEVTRVDEPNATFYFKMPDDPQYQSGGWQHDHDKSLLNEDNSIAWNSAYPGTSFHFNLSGAPVDEAAFPDADHDGKRKVLVCHYGPGDEFALETHVAVTRLAPGKYEIRTNVPCTITLPDKGKWVQLDDNGKSQPARVTTAGALTAVHITAEMLNGKPIVVQCVK